jgi:hypothetical protein
MRVFVPGKLFQPSLMFVGKAYLRVEHLKIESLATVIMTMNPFSRVFQVSWSYYLGWLGVGGCFVTSVSVYILTRNQSYPFVTAKIS